MDKKPTITFIGAGNMTRSIIGGLIAAGYPAQNICATNPSVEKLAKLKNDFGIKITQDNQTGVNQAEIIVLAVKPRLLKSVVTELAPLLKERNPLIISVAAMITTKHLERWLHRECAIVRAMPNIASLIKCGATGLYANAKVSEAQQNIAEAIMRAVGLTVWINDEAQLDTITVLSGSGPAYFFLVMESMQQAAEKMGLSKETARLLTLETALGAARLAIETEHDLTSLRQQVTSKGGTTERAVSILEEGNIRQLFLDALEAGRQRAVELAETLDKEI